MQSSLTKDGLGRHRPGLSICRKIIEAHGGRIHAENRPEGGAQFFIHLPARGMTETAPVPRTLRRYTALSADLFRLCERLYKSS